ncbi:MAG: FtsW/RodA/SpoVE family cell cycle protein, partial [Chloroflexi bacterium]|nr:FtsW/RodA/SpoVE family cell cycle protein [Chloroflexota bacterium]
MAILRNTYQTADMRRSGWRFFDYFTLILVITLITIGVLMINSATLNSTDPDLAGAARRQGIYAIVGIAIMLITATIDYRVWQNARHGLYGAAIVFLLVTLVFGTGEIGGVGRWLTFLEAFPVQPAELAKVLMILSLAGFLADRRDEMDQFKNVALSLVYIGIPAGLIFLQPNLSTAVVFVFIWLGMMITAGVKARHLAVIGGAGIAALPVVWAAMAQYQRDRVLAFLNPERNPATNYNLDQALIGIGSGGWLGQGYNAGTQSQLHFLKVRHTDFIFSVTAEELGFVGAVLLLILF